MNTYHTQQRDGNKLVDLYGIQFDTDRLWCIGFYRYGFDLRWMIYSTKPHTSSTIIQSFMYYIRRPIHLLKVDLTRLYYTIKGISYDMCEMCGENIATRKSMDPNDTGIIMNMCRSCYIFCGIPVRGGEDPDYSRNPSFGCYFCGGTRGILSTVNHLNLGKVKVHKECVCHRARRQESHAALQMAEELEIGKMVMQNKGPDIYVENPFWYSKHLDERWGIKRK